MREGASNTYSDKIKGHLRWFGHVLRRRPTDALWRVKMLKRDEVDLKAHGRKLSQNTYILGTDLAKDRKQGGKYLYR